MAYINKSAKNLFYSINGQMSQVDFRYKLRDDLRLPIEQKVYDEFIRDMLNSFNGQVDLEKFFKILESNASNLFPLS